MKNLLIRTAAIHAQPPNQAKQRTVARCTLHFEVISTLLLRATRRSSLAHVLLVRRMRNFLVSAIVCVASQSYAGMEQSFVCRQCGLKGTFLRGPLLTADQFVAFCPKDYFVDISWDYHKRARKPLGFDRGAPVYSCPVCKKPIARRWDEKECPRCGSTDIRIRSTRMAVD
jgi:Zn finger protein HypA/HybF involved in hydrogenase expression